MEGGPDHPESIAGQPIRNPDYFNRDSSRPTFFVPDAPAPGYFQGSSNAAPNGSLASLPAAFVVSGTLTLTKTAHPPTDAGR
jgi:hypothetical protein